MEVQAYHLSQSVNALASVHCWYGILLDELHPFADADPSLTSRTQPKCEYFVYHHSANFLPVLYSLLRHGGV